MILGVLLVLLLAGCGKSGQNSQATTSTQSATGPGGEATTSQSSTAGSQSSGTTSQPSTTGSGPKNYDALRLRLAKAIGDKINKIGLTEEKLGEKEECGEVTGLPGNESALLTECYYEFISDPNTSEPRREIWGYDVHLTNEESYTASANRVNGHEFAERGCKESGCVLELSGSLSE